MIPQSRRTVVAAQTRRLNPHLSVQAFAKLPQLVLQPPRFSHGFDCLHQQHHRVRVDICGSVVEYPRRVNIGFIGCQQLSPAA